MAMANAAFCSRPMHDIPPSGDAWYYVKKADTIRMMLADGLGHGINAHRIVLHLIKQISWLSERSGSLPPIDESLIQLDEHLKSLNEQSAQAAVSIVDINIANHSLTAAGVGNISTYQFSNGQDHHFPALNGMIGGRMPSRLQVQHYTVTEPAVIAMFSDGLHIQTAQQYLLRLSESTGLMRHSAQTITNQVVHCSRSMDDDASCALITLLAEP